MSSTPQSDPSNKSHFELAIAFRQAMDQPIGTTDDSIFELQENLIYEEYNEFLDAVSEEILTETGSEETLKELSDLVFVCYQYAAARGWDLDEALRRIHASNMSKLDDNGKPIYRKDGKIMKGPNYRKPDLTNLV